MADGRERVQALVAQLLGRRVYPDRQRVVKILPSSPPRRGETINLDGVRCRVTRCKVSWEGRQWTIRSLYVRTIA